MIQLPSSGGLIFHYKKSVFFVMPPKIVDVLLDINILEKEM
jgi:hypothetical protein